MDPASVARRLTNRIYARRKLQCGDKPNYTVRQGNARDWLEKFDECGEMALIVHILSHQILELRLRRFISVSEITEGSSQKTPGKIS
jgi:hypothetical protein